MTAIEERELLARIDQTLADLELKQEQIRQMKGFPTGTYEGWKLAFAGMTAGATLFAAGAAFITLDRKAVVRKLQIIY